MNATPKPADPDLGELKPGHVCKHGVRWPHRCDPCAEAAWALRQCQSPRQCLRGPDEPEREGPCSAGLCAWPYCVQPNAPRQRRRMLPSICISIRQPWAWMILHAGKDIENRTWPTKFRGPVLIHAAKRSTRWEHETARAFADRLTGRSIPTADHLERGGIVGVVEIVDCVQHSKSGWFEDVGFGFVLRNPRPLPFTLCRGALGFFPLPLGVEVKEEQP